MSTRGYGYIGPEELRPQAGGGAAGRAIRTSADLDVWMAERGAQEAAEPFTYVIGLDGLLRLAPRRSEHVACAGGGRVLAAGELGLTRGPGGWAVQDVSNQSTGYCPDLDSWHSVRAALDALGIEHPGGFTHEVVFRRCPACAEVGIVREGDFVCVFCGAELPARWNIAP
ncbi:hypothetical protein [Streptomyces griseorubiginosus]|uniref:hypothetical protein n=1 Tax=Streptomyces griseorubiginosus TaxID=67304 RepID=UPI001FCABC93|nr:hypothetical protein [Streptomyces griseorubiginosus]MBO4252883.1 hypothetical protein [Streptomyces griseorubiginosus]